MFIEVSNYRGSQRIRLMRQVKVDGKWKKQLVEHIGSASNETELNLLKSKAKKRLEELKPQQNLMLWPEAAAPSDLRLSQPFAWGLWQVIGGIYDELKLPPGPLKYLVLARIALPKSKLATARYLESSLGYKISGSAIYKFMDSLSQSMIMDRLLAYAKADAARESHTISVVFYDVTTLYFENDQEDEDDSSTAGMESILGLRKYGYSKDHRSDQPQIVIGLTVDAGGFPLDFAVYEGNTYEGHTLLKGVNTVNRKLGLTPSELTVVADAGMLSGANLTELENQGYRYIVGARLKSMNEAYTRLLLNHDYQKDNTLDTILPGNSQTRRRLIVTYADKRAERHRQNRNRLIRRLKARLARGEVVKRSKYVSLEGAKKLAGRIDYAKVEADARFDGLRGYVTNTALKTEEVAERYANLWQVEKSFRMSKTDLKARPTFHYRRQRIISHLAICVVALAVLRLFNQKLATLPADDGELPVGQTIALEQLLAIWQYQLSFKGSASFPIYTELNKLQEQLLKL